MPDSKRKDIVLAVPATPDYLDTIRLVMYGVGAQQGYSYEDIEDMKVAVTETCTYVLLQRKEEADGGQLQVTFEQAEGELRIRIRLEGGSISYDALSAEITPPAGAESLDSEQIGLFLIQAMVDEVAVDTLNDGSREVVLVKRRNQ